MGIVVIGAVFVDIKGFPLDAYIPTGRNAGTIKYIHGGVSRNVVEDIANIELRPTFLSIVDDSPLGKDVLERLNDHKVNTQYVQTIPGGMGTWLAVFDQNGDVAGSISQRPNLLPILGLLQKKGDEIISKCDSIVLEADIDEEIINLVFILAKKYNKAVYPIVSNISIGLERRDLLKKFNCFICNQQEAGLLFNEDYSEKSPDELCKIIEEKKKIDNMPSLVITMGEKGAVYVDQNGNSGICPAHKVQVNDTTGAGDAFCAGVVAGLTYGKTLQESVNIGTHLAASVIVSSENVCPLFSPDEFGINIE